MANSPSFIAIADVHLGLNLYNQPELGQDLRRLFTEVNSLAIAKKVNFLVIAGDLFDSNRPTPELIRFVREEIERLRLQGIRVIGIAGDHDKPVLKEAWTRISGVQQIDSAPAFAGRDYSDNPLDVMNHIQSNPRCATAEWIVLHGQVPTLWSFCEERKKLDIGKLDLFRLYPNLRGVLLGDIHKPYQGTLTDPASGRTAFIGYCGSLGITSSSDIGASLGVLHFDGTQLQRIPFPLGREFVRIDLTANGTNEFEIGYYLDRFRNHRGRAPVFLIEYSPSTKHRLVEARGLYPLGFVRCIQVRQKAADGEHDTKQAVNIRAELRNEQRIEQVLGGLIPDTEVRDLVLSALHTEDPKIILDGFRQQYLGSLSST